MFRILPFIFLICITATGWAQFPEVSFQDIQEVSEADLMMDMDLSYLDGDTVTVQGIVTFDPCDYALSSSGSRMGTFLQTPTGEAWGGMHILIDPGASGYSGSLEELNNATLFVDNFQVGNEVKATGIVTDFSGLTQMVLLPIESEIQSFSTMPDPLLMTIDSFMASDGGGGQVLQRIPGEKYEGVYVEFQNVFAVNITPSGDRFFWDVQDSEGNAIAVRDVSGHFRNDTNDDECPLWLTGTSGISNTPTTFAPPALGSNLEYMRGVVFEYNGEYYITPLTPDDVGPTTVSPPVVNNMTIDPAVPSSTDIVNLSAEIFDTDGTITSATLYYSVGLGSTDFTAVAMTNTGGDVFEGPIPATTTDSTYVNYWIRAVDNDANVTDNPDDMATGSFYLVYDDGINTIERVQKTSFSGGGSIWAGDSVPLDITAIVTATTKTYDLGLLTLQDNTIPWSGIFVQSSAGDGTDGLFRGDEINITSATVIENFGVTYLSNMEFELMSSSNPLPDFTTGLNPDSIDAEIFDWSEPYEGMLVRFDDAYITSENADDPSTFGEFRFNTVDVPETGLRVDDLSFAVPFEFGIDSVDVGDELGFIQGPLYFSFGNYKLVPRDLNDIDGFSTEFPNDIVSFNFEGLSPAVNGEIDQDALTITLNIGSSADITALTPTIETTGQLIEPASGEVQDFTNPVVYTTYAPTSGEAKDYTVTVNKSVGIEELNAIDGINIYPNPSTGVVYIDLDMAESGDFNISVLNVTGAVQIVSEQFIKEGISSMELDLSDLSDGMYFIEFRNETGKIISKINLVK